jgi:hypothetical protein
MRQSSDDPVKALRSLALELAAKAIALCCAGDARNGIETYKRALLTGNGSDVLPVGVHVQLLLNAGLHEVADTIRDIAVRHGANLCIGAFLGKTPAEIASEYRELFASGYSNTAMIADFLDQLDKLGQTAELASFCDTDRVVRQFEIAIEDEETFWETTARVLCGIRSDRTWHESVLSLRNSDYIERLDQHTDQHVRRLLDEVDDRVRQYIVEMGGGPGVAGRTPKAFCVRPWAVISAGDGYNVPHIHGQGWISGVLFVAGPEGVGADGYPLGALRVGPPKSASSPAGWPDLAIAPKPGTLVLMPSYFTHWTLPLGRPGLRISIPFDVSDP